MKQFSEALNCLPKEYPVKLMDSNRKDFLSNKLSIVVLDDDPTGTQTIFDVPVLTTWGEKEIADEFRKEIPLFFILTNSRSLLAGKANELAFEIGKNIKSASEKTQRNVIVISRGDSTLRGHYPNEVDALGSGLEITDSPHIIIPAFFQGGRHTIGDVHFVREGDWLIPAGETPFARDSTFGYAASDLKHYVEEKTKGRIKAKNVKSISIEDIRIGGPEKVCSVLLALDKKEVCVVNAVSQPDLDVFVAGFYLFLKNGKSVLFRTAASIVPSLAGLPVKKPLAAHELNMQGKGGIIAVGSYVPKTTEQLQFLKTKFKTEYIELHARALLNEKTCVNEIIRVSTTINAKLQQNQVVVLYTSRGLIKGNDADESLKIVNMVSNGMVQVIKQVSIQPTFFIAKGGITSSDIVNKSLEVKRAHVLGQIIPGVPVWKLDDCKSFPGLLYMPFPGNLGDKETLFQAVKKLISPKN